MATEGENEQEAGVQIQTLSGGEALESIDRASMDVQISTAKRYPRSVTEALNQAVTLATMDEETAASMTYGLRRGHKIVSGPSVRLAEVLAYSWGNLRAEAVIVAEDAKSVTAMGTCFDLEKNMATRVQASRRITDSQGRRYNDDMINTTKNAAISIALRNAVFRTIPRALADRVWAEAKQVALGKGAKSVSQKRQAMIEWYGSQGVEPEQVYELLGVGGIDDIGENELIDLRGLANAIKEGEATIEETFFAGTPSEKAQRKTQAKVERLKEEMKDRNASSQEQKGAEIRKEVEDDLPDFGEEPPPPPAEKPSAAQAAFESAWEKLAGPDVEMEGWLDAWVGVAPSAMNDATYRRATKLLAQGIGLPGEEEWPDDHGEMPV